MSGVCRRMDSPLARTKCMSNSILARIVAAQAVCTQALTRSSFSGLHGHSHPMSMSQQRLAFISTRSSPVIDRIISSRPKISPRLKTRCKAQRQSLSFLPKP